MGNLMSIAGRTLNLERIPLREREPLRAWDAADEYVLKHVVSEALDLDAVLILNDAFGALSLALADGGPILVTDSHLARLALAHNAEINALNIDSVRVFDPLEPWEMTPRLVVMKLPKSNALLRHQLHLLRDRLTADVPIIAAGMVKHIHTSTLKIFESVIGPTRTSLAKKKARLIFSELDPDLDPRFSEGPSAYELPEYGLTLVEYPGVFSQGRLDRGTRLLLANLPVTEGRCVDLGCGNGVLGIAVGRESPQSEVLFIDESHLAVASARAGWRANDLESERAQFRANDCLTGIEPESADLILCNPPFHQGQSMGDQIAWRMLTQARSVLRPGGELRVVGNRHLGYHVKLARIFGRCETIASDSKFVVLSARRPL